MINEITFIVKGTDDKNSLGRCLKSIYRQSNKSYRIVVITNLDESDIEPFNNDEKTEFVFIKKKKDFLKTANAQIKQLKSRYFIYVNSDSIIPPDAVEKILDCDADVVVFNISRQGSNKRFGSVYPRGDKFTLAKYIKCGVSVWNNAISTEYVINEKHFLTDWSYFSQLMYLLKIYSGVRTVGLISDVLICRSTLIRKKKISYAQFSANRRLLTKIMKGFAEKDMNDVKRQLVADFVLSNMGEYYKEKRFIFRLIKKHRFKKYIFM